MNFQCSTAHIAEYAKSISLTTEKIPGETVDLKFTTTTFQGEIAYFIFEINGYNPKDIYMK